MRLLRRQPASRSTSYRWFVQNVVPSSGGRMNKSDRADVRQVHVRVNGITFESVRIRHELGANDFDIVIDDPHVGRFALTPAVPDLELRDEDSDWRQVTLDELKKILADDSELAEAAEEPPASETVGRESFNRLVAEGEQN